MAKINLKKAAKGRTSFDVSQEHLTTSDFGQIQVSSFMEVVPSDTVTCNVFSEARFAPMVVPTFMKCNLVTRAFFVPMSAIYKPFENFITDRQETNILKNLPTFTNQDLVGVLKNSTYARVASSDEKDDFTLLVDSVVTRYVFTERGRLIYKLLLSLGYSVNFCWTDQTSQSMLPLLAFLRVCYDYVYPSQYVENLNLTSLFLVSSSSDYATHLQYIESIINKINACIDLPYRQDYFTAAWKTYNSPGSPQGQIRLSEPVGTYTNEITSSSQNVFVKTQNAYLSQNAINVLSRLYDFVTRNNLLGSRFADQIFGRFGIGSTKSDKDMSRFIGQHIQPIKIMDVTAMTAAQGQDLGDLAGKAYLQGDGHLFSIDDIDEYGYILSLSFIMPQIGYYQGRKRHTLHTSRFDFYTPEFDMQLRAIRNDEVFSDFKDYLSYQNAANFGGVPENVFGFAPNYSEYKKPESFLTGDFRTPSISENLKSYFLFRDIPLPSSSNPLALNKQFLFTRQHEFDKIFAQPYVVREPLSLSEWNNTFRAYLVLHNGKNVLFKYQLGSATSDIRYWLLMKTYDGHIVVHPYNESQVASLTDKEIITGSLDGTEVNFSFLGKTYLISAGVGSTSFLSSSTTHGNENAFVTLVLAGSPLVYCDWYEDFLQPFCDYIDHIYLHHSFDIKASRPMVPISQEFMIEDGGDTVSADLLGNRIV